MDKESGKAFLNEFIVKLSSEENEKKLTNGREG